MVWISSLRFGSQFNFKAACIFYFLKFFWNSWAGS
ncbi:hypothetical protein GLYMA_06G077500v4 [Glycine max]|uniref:Uncharacterized protein n=1 Tax=Glycine max TaxID=3847 RepID=A0A0R0JNM8_SOYBN|nr:hypothetical protein GYH30_014395 [Glycine max]KRH52607.1 hypothetical protein GLYMA_06G077500v4 [Glycine max]